MSKPCINEYMRVTCTVCKTERTISLTTKDVSCPICRRKKELDKELQEESAARIKELEEELKFEKIRFKVLAETIKGVFA